ncbi:MAG: hypothetical protein KA536_15230 [Saprospiraceae bacterium]|nr:hypothetical protein [Saprospiraceae bacterium]
MENISSVVEKFKIDNPSADNSIIISHLKSFGYSDYEIKKFFFDETEEIIEHLRNYDMDEMPDVCEAMPDIFDPFDFPDDIIEELSGKE